MSQEEGRGRLLGRFRGALRLRRGTRARSLAEVWLFKRWPIESLDADRLADPPFADIGGIAGRIEEIKDSVRRGLGGIYAVVGPMGSGKTTFLKRLVAELREGNIPAYYVSAKGKSLQELITLLCQPLPCKGFTVDNLVEALVEASQAFRAIAIAIDDIDTIKSTNLVEDVSRLLLAFVTAYEKRVHTLLVVFSCSREFIARLSLDNVMRGVISSYVKIIDLEEHLVKTVVDLSRLYYAHMSRARPENIDAKAAKLLKRYPLYPITSEDVLKALIEAIGPATPRIYLEKLDELLKVAAKTRSKTITASHLNIILRRLALGGRAVPPSMLQSLAVRHYVSGLATGGLVALGSAAITLALMGLTPAFMRPIYLVLGLALIAAGMVLHLRSIRATPGL